MVTRKEILDAQFNEMATDWRQFQYMQEMYDNYMKMPAYQFVQESGLPLKIIRNDLFYITYN